MKKLHWVLAAGGGLCALGILIAGAGLALSGFEFYGAVTTLKYEQKTADFDAALLQGIDLAADGLTLTISPSSDSRVHLSYWESPLDTVDLGVADGRLSFRHTASESPLDNFLYGFWSSFARLRRTIEVKIPAGYAGELLAHNDNASVKAWGLTALAAADFSAKNASLSLTDITCAGALSAGTSNASLSLERVKAGAAQITDTNARVRLDGVTLGDTMLQTDNGSVLLHDVRVSALTAKTKNASLEAESLTGTGRIELETTNGSLTAIGVQTEGELSLKSKNGGVRATGCTAAFLGAETTNAKIDLTRCAAGRVQAGTTNGSVEFERLDSRDITISSTNGGVRGTVLGREADYVILAQTTNGGSNLTNQVGDLPGRLNVSTTNASIRVTFAE